MVSNMNMNFNVDLKKMVREAGTVMSRVVQLTEEKLGTSEKTELDAHFENLASRADAAKLWTEKLLRDTESVVTPNPGNRVEDFLYEKIEKKKPTRLSNLEYLGQDMIEAGNEFGPGTPYGASLIKVGTYEQKLGQNEREFINSVNTCYLAPLKKYLDGEMKTITTERGVLESKRLDLDACKNRVRKARSMLGQPAKDGPSPEYLLEVAERDLRVAQGEFDRQVEITKLLLEGVGNSLGSHHRCLHDLVDAQLAYYQECVRTMEQLKNDLVSDRKPSPVLRVNSEEIDLASSVSLTEHNHTCPSSTRSSSSSELSSSKRTLTARVLSSYSAKDSTELNVFAGEVIDVEPANDPNPQYLMASRGSSRGKVPAVCIQIYSQ